MMVNSISSVHFCGEADNILSRPGRFSNPDAQQQASVPAASAAPEEKKQSSGTGKKVIGTVAALAVVAAALAAAPKVFPNAIKVLKGNELKDAKWGQKIGHYVATAGEFISKYTYQPIVKLFSKNKDVKPAPSTDSKIFA